MPAIYLTNVIGGTNPRLDPFRSSIIIDEGVYFTLMIDNGPKARSVVWADKDLNATGEGVIQFQQAATKDELIALLQFTNISTPQRNVVNNWLTASGYTTLPTGTLSQYDAILFVCRQVNPAVDLSVMIA